MLKHKSLLVLLVLASTLNAYAVKFINIPKESRGFIENVYRLCPSCKKAGVVICGRHDVGYGKNYAPKAFKGNPLRTYILTQKANDRELIKKIKEFSLVDFEKYLEKKLSKIEMIRVELGFSGATSLGRPDSVEVSVSKRLYQCMQNESKKYGEGGCWPKTMGYIEYTMQWDDPKGSEKLTLKSERYSWLYRMGKEGKTVYFCNLNGLMKLRYR